MRDHQFVLRLPSLTLFSDLWFVISTSVLCEEKSRTIEKRRFLFLAEFTLSNVEGLIVELTYHPFTHPAPCGGAFENDTEGVHPLELAIIAKGEKMETRKVAYAVVLTAIAVAGGVVFSIPVAGSQISPAQHLVNVLSAILLGPWYAVAVALATSIIRNAVGRGTLFAFPGSMIGAFLAGYVYVLTRNIYLAALAEIFGTGILGSLVSVFLVAPAFVNRPVNALVLTVSFLLSTIVGSIIGLMGIVALQRAGVLRMASAEK